MDPLIKPSPTLICLLVLVFHCFAIKDRNTAGSFKVLLFLVIVPVLCYNLLTTLIQGANSLTSSSSHSQEINRDRCIRVFFSCFLVLKKYILDFMIIIILDIFPKDVCLNVVRQPRLQTKHLELSWFLKP